MSGKQPTRKQSKSRKNKPVTPKSNETEPTTNKEVENERGRERVRRERSRDQKRGGKRESGNGPDEKSVKEEEKELKEEIPKEAETSEQPEEQEGGTNKDGVTIINIHDDEEEYEAPNSVETKGRSNNPKIMISEPVMTPGSAEPPPPPKVRCPIYYGIKSYIHDFYQPPDKEVLKSGEFVQEDDFQFLVEPGKRRWRNWWLRAALWVGVNLMLLGVIALLVGHLTSPRQTVVRQQNVTVLDRWAVTFNNRLVICQLAGLAAFTSGAVVVMLALLVSSYQSPGYYVMAATVLPEAMMATPQSRQYFGRIPLSGSVRGVQPTFVRTG